MYKITKEFHFSASHILSGLPSTHPCARLHGHNYVVEVLLQSDVLNEVGFVEDYRDLDDMKQYIDNVLDHRHLNDVFQFNPTAENMAAHLFGLFKPLHPAIAQVSVCETPKTRASYVMS